MTRNERNAEAAIAETMLLQQVANWMLERWLAQLRELESEIVTEVMMADVVGGRTESSRRIRLAGLLQRLQERIRAVFDELASRAEEDLENLAGIEAERERKRMLAIFGLKLDGTVDGAAIATAAVLGITVRQMMAKQALDLSYRLRGRLTQALDSMEPAATTVGGLRNGVESKAEPPVMAGARRTLETIAHTTVAATADEARKELVKESAPDKRTVRYGWQQISILDARTTRICWAYAFKTWDANFEPLGHTLPYNGGVPRHPYCRSSIILILLDEDEIAEQTFRQWALSVGRDRLDKIFGKEKVQQWLDGSISDGDLIRAKTGTISLDELAALGEE